MKQYVLASKAILRNETKCNLPGAGCFETCHLSETLQHREPFLTLVPFLEARSWRSRDKVAGQGTVLGLESSTDYAFKVPPRPLWAPSDLPPGGNKSPYYEPLQPHVLHQHFPALTKVGMTHLFVWLFD